MLQGTWHSRFTTGLRSLQPGDISGVPGEGLMCSRGHGTHGLPRDYDPCSQVTYLGSLEKDTCAPGDMALTVYHETTIPAAR